MGAEGDLPPDTYPCRASPKLTSLDLPVRTSAQGTQLAALGRRAVGVVRGVMLPK
jgi:hypothetical protein